MANERESEDILLLLVWNVRTSVLERSPPVQ